MTTQLDSEETESSRARSVASPMTGEPVRLFSREWFAGLALRYAMVLVMLLVIAYFSYRSARFGTVDNLVTILVAAAPFALIALGQTLGDPHRRYRPVGRQRHRGVGDGGGGHREGQSRAGVADRSGRHDGRPRGRLR